MTIPASTNSLLLKAPAGGGGGGYAIERSLRFNSADSAYLSRTPASAGNRKTWTWAGWVKRSKPGNIDHLFNATGYALLYFFSNDEFTFDNGAASNLTTSQVFRDFSAWYHVVLAFDTTQATASNRTKLYINGVQVTAFSTETYPVLNTDYAINNTGEHRIGNWSSEYKNGYLADIHFIDGQALTPTSFGEFDTNGIWQPKAYTGSYGTNGFHLPFSDNSTAAALGTDTSGNSNTWTVNNLSVAAGAANDSLVDSPTNGTQTDTGVGGEVVGNYCTWNPLKKATAGSFSFSNGNLEVINQAYAYGTAVGTIFATSGKWYWEIAFTGTVDSMWDSLGIQAADVLGESYPGGFVGLYGYLANGSKINNDGGYIGASYGSSYASSDVIGVAFDADNGTLTFYKNGVSQGQAFSGITSSKGWAPYVGDYSYAITVTSWIANFGQHPFAYAAPSGFKSLNTANLPTPTITTSGSYTGNGAADGPFVYLDGVPTAMTVGGNAVTFGTHADKLSNGFKIRTAHTTYNQNSYNYNYTITTTGAPFKTARAQVNP